MITTKKVTSHHFSSEVAFCILTEAKISKMHANYEY